MQGLWNLGWGLGCSGRSMVKLKRTFWSVGVLCLYGGGGCLDMYLCQNSCTGHLKYVLLYVSHTSIKLI